MHVETYETEASAWEVAHRAAYPALRPYLLSQPEGWRQSRGNQPIELREIPFPGVPLILNFAGEWVVDSDRRDSFLAGLHTRPAFVSGSAEWACIELRLTPVGAHRLLRMPMHELANATVELADVLPGAHELSGRLRDAETWAERFDLVDRFLLKRFVHSTPPAPPVAWSWAHLRSTGGGAPIKTLADESGWSQRLFIKRFREHVGVAPKTFARLVRFDRAVTAVRSPDKRSLGEIAFDCGYFDQSHMNRDFRELAGMTPTQLAAA